MSVDQNLRTLYKELCQREKAEISQTILQSYIYLYSPFTYSIIFFLTPEYTAKNSF